ncbi:MAG TPA: glucose-6-phosphate isomerase, partial [bacterium]|nr:glucose-6-phosphate isomerase [bacterium]
MGLKKKSIYINYSYTQESAIGPNGLHPEELQEAGETLIPKALQALEEKHKNGTLGFMDLPFREGETDAIQKLAMELRTKYKNFLLVGIGGSALGNRAIFEALAHSCHNILPKGKRSECPRFFIFDNADPHLIESYLDATSIKRSLINVISKSGSTTETLANFFILLKNMINKVGDPDYKKHLIIITDPEKGYLREIAARENILSFSIPPNVGGRFSVLSAAGLLSSSFLGIDIKEILHGAQYMAKKCSSPDWKENPAALFALLSRLFSAKNRNI